MNFDLILVFGLIVHWWADFVLQSHWQATSKAINNDALLEHTMTYSTVWFAFMLVIYNITGYTESEAPILAFLFASATFVAHTTTDFITSRLSKKFFDKKDFHNWFVVIGLDQILHYLQLYFTYKLLS